MPHCLPAVCCRSLLVLGMTVGLLSAGARIVWAQPEAATVLGRLLDAETGETVPGAHVFIAASMIGTVTAPDGSFRLDDVPLGAHRIFATMVGYAPATVDTVLRAPGSYELELTLAPVVVEIPELTVSAERDARWPRRKRKFDRLFLGESVQARDVRVLNPEVLSFDAKWWGRFRAHAAAPLVVENQALGYRLTYFLKVFEMSGSTLRYDGEPLFEELEPADADEAERWATNRRQAYHGSFRHFLLSLLEGTTNRDGFITYLLPDAKLRGTGSSRFRLNPEDILQPGPSVQEWMLQFRGFIEIVYTHEEESPAFLAWQGRHRHRSARSQTSYIELTDGPTLVDHTGEVIDPFGVTTYGYFAFERIAEMLPKEYRPDPGSDASSWVGDAPDP
ncbi:MAG: carboxypeptidase-like regulatory domain-containing protein [Bacteroidota bacterium]